MCSTVGRLAFGARWTRSEKNMEGLMPIRIRCRDKMSASTQHLDIWKVKTEMMPFSKAPCKAIEAMFGVLYGSI